MTIKRFRTVGSSTKIDNNPPKIKAGRTFATVGTAAPKKDSKPVTVVAKNDTSVVIVTADRKPPFDLDGTETTFQSVEVSVPTLRRPAKAAPVAEKPKAKPTQSKAPVPAKKAGEKPALAKRNTKVTPEVTAPVVVTKALKEVLAKADKAVAKSAPVKAAVKELTAVRSTPVKPGKIADKAKYEQAKKAGVITEVAPKAKAVKKSTPIKPAKTVKAPVTKIENSTPAGTKAKKDTKVLNKAPVAKAVKAKPAKK